MKLSPVITHSFPTFNLKELRNVKYNSVKLNCLCEDPTVMLFKDETSVVLIHLQECSINLLPWIGSVCLEKRNISDLYEAAWTGISKHSWWCRAGAQYFSRPVSRAKVTTMREEWDSRKSLFFFLFCFELITIKFCRS